MVKKLNFHAEIIEKVRVEIDVKFVTQQKKEQGRTTSNIS